MTDFPFMHLFVPVTPKTQMAQVIVLHKSDEEFINNQSIHCLELAHDIDVGQEIFNILKISLTVAKGIFERLFITCTSRTSNCISQPSFL
ncbi:hypothetical protein V6Z11_A06G086900 [Gossypium hirsutum]